MGVMAHPIDEATVQRLTSRLMGAYASWSAARAEVRDQASAPDREWSIHAEEVLCSAIPEGTLAKARDGERYALLLVWAKDYGERVLTQGSREHVDRYALDVALYGPPGGPEFWNQRPGWHCTGGDDTLHAVTVGGEFRLMPLVSGEHILLFARNNVGLCVLGVGEPEALQRTAHERLQRFYGDVLHVRVGDRRVALRDIAAAGVLGQVDAVGGDRLVLGHLAGDQFGLIVMHGETPGECIGRYSLDELRRGDLGQVLTWNHQEARPAQHRDDERDLEPREVRPAPRTSPARPGATKPRRQRPRPPTRAAKLSATDLALVEDHLTPKTPATGDGATMAPAVFKGLRGLVRLGLDNLLLYGCQLKRLIEDRCGIAFHCCTKTFGRAVAAVAAHLRGASPSAPVSLLTRVGRRWLLRIGDLRLVESELLRCIAELAAKKAISSARPTAGSGPRSTGSLADLWPAPDRDLADPPSAASRSWSAPDRNRADPPSAVSGFWLEPPPGASADLDGDLGGAIRADPQEAGGVPPAGATPHGAAAEPDELDLWFRAQGTRPMLRLRGARSPPVTRSSLPADQSASRWSGTKIARGPPGESDESE